MSDADPDRVRIVIEIPKIDIPVFGYGLTLGAMVARQRSPFPLVGELVDYIGDAIIAAERGVDVEDLDEEVLAAHTLQTVQELQATTNPGDLRPDRRVDVSIEEVDPDD